MAIDKPGFYEDTYKKIFLYKGEKNEKEQLKIYSVDGSSTHIQKNGFYFNSANIIEKLKKRAYELRELSDWILTESRKLKYKTSAQSLPKCTDEPLEAGGNHPFRKDGPYQGPEKKYSEPNT